MSEFQNPKGRFLLIECEDIGEMVRIGTANGLLREIVPGFGREWPPEIMVLPEQRGFRKTGRQLYVEGEGYQDELQFSPHLYVVILDADMSDPRWQDFRIVREQPQWEVDHFWEQ